MLATRSRSSLLFSLALLAQSIGIASSFAISSSTSPKRGKKISSQGKAPGGFAKKAPDSVPTSHTRDESAPTEQLIKFLLQLKSQGMGPDAGTEVGYDMANGIRGVYATKSFKKNELVCKIPSDVALALSDPSLSTTKETMTMADGALNFLRWYQNDEKARQIWSVYLDTLPTRGAHFDVRIFILCHV